MNDQQLLRAILEKLDNAIEKLDRILEANEGEPHDASS